MDWGAILPIASEGAKVIGGAIAGSLVTIGAQRMHDHRAEVGTRVHVTALVIKVTQRLKAAAEPGSSLKFAIENVEQSLAEFVARVREKDIAQAFNRGEQECLYSLADGSETVLSFFTANRDQAVKAGFSQDYIYEEFDIAESLRAICCSLAEAFDAGLAVLEPEIVLQAAKDRFADVTGAINAAEEDLKKSEASRVAAANDAAQRNAGLGPHN